MKFARPRQEEPDVNLTPLIDVVFLLLIFFMVSTTFQREEEIAIELPEANGEPVQSERVRLEILIDKQGTYFVNGAEVVNTQVESLMAAIGKTLGEAEPEIVVLSADQQTPHQSVMSAMDAAQRMGLTHITFSVNKPREGE